MQPAFQRPTVTTPVQEYTHPEFENNVTLVGVVHVAQAPYYQSVANIIAEREAQGATVHYEGMGKPALEDIGTASRSEIANAERLQNALGTIYSWFENSGLAFQGQVLEYKDNWENHDASILELGRKMGGFTTRRFAGDVGFMDRILKNAGPNVKYRFMLRVTTSLMQGFEESSLDWKSRLFFGNISKAVLDYRNGVALEALDGHLGANPEDSLVLLWGAAHLQGLGTGLESRGFEKIDEHRIKAIDVISALSPLVDPRVLGK